MSKLNKKGFVDFLLKNQVLMIGDFITKSGRKTPYFFNFGRVFEGGALSLLAGMYAKVIIEQFSKSNFTKQSPLVIFGPAYKGIPLAVAITIELNRRGFSAMYVFNRKEAKTHGDKGVLVGKELTAKDQVIVVDDVITSGISISESIKLITKTYSAKVLGVVIAVDREEAPINTNKNFFKSNQAITAANTMGEKFNIRLHSIMKINEVFVTGLRNKLITKKDYQSFKKYLSGEKK